MKKMYILFFLLFTSCAGYVNNLHRQIDNETRPQRQGYAPQRHYQTNQYSGPNDRRPINSPVTLGGNATTANTQNYYPGVDRNYESKKRYRASDLVDNGDDGSLWSGNKKENFLFVTNNLKNQGDIVIVEVLSDFKEEITAELKRAYPIKETKEKDTKVDDKAPAVAQASKESKEEEEVYDKISTQVMERTNGDYLFIKGRKEVVFNKGRRFVEIQGLVSQKHISSNDTVLSDKILEPKIRVLRY